MLKLMFFPHRLYKFESFLGHMPGGIIFATNVDSIGKIWVIARKRFNRKNSFRYVDIVLIS